MTQPGPEGLPAERTALAWSRTSLAVLVNGVLLILKDSRHPGAIAGKLYQPCAAYGANFALMGTIRGSRGASKKLGLRWRISSSPLIDQSKFFCPSSFRNT